MMCLDESMHNSVVRPSVNRFNQLSGRLRISVTHSCQLSCKFCHREGIDSHWQPIHMSIEFFQSLVDSFSHIGGREINLTGGEPLMHPQISDLIERASNPQWKLALCTNGLLLERVFPQVERKLLDEIKLSLHATSDDIGKEMLGEVWSQAKLERNIETAIGLGANIKLNYTYTQVNSSCIEDILHKASKWDVDLMILDLIATRWSENDNGLGRLSVKELETLFAQYARPVGIIADNTGCKLRLYKTPTGKNWTLKDADYGLLFTKMCRNCALRNICGEGVFVLRVDANHVFRPCLLRKDLEQSIDPSKLTDETVQEKLLEMINLMMGDDIAAEQP